MKSAKHDTNDYFMQIENLLRLGYQFGFEICEAKETSELEV